ncbi:efflux transporter outer membrane subunit [Massilia sp. CCM 8733]|uniref:Efflux transporter outer membrane subunit n=1 Tax=Massilia mucilaginosa TaxID=2609282 RepID=A0ABX0NQX4_9BURK|nr:efflux transporter outer membrane subunit [Massilia mucilaginosa]NHZ89274.1 efflux transporter outer membrane subunit [Massilia mucilaginosa]
MKIVHVLSAALLPLALGGCALAPPAKTDAPVAPQWQAPLPHNGSLTDLSAWWREQGDPLLAQLVEAAQTASPNVATARSRIVQSRADRVAAGAALAPTLDASMSVSRANQQGAQPGGTTSQGGLQSAWEIDLFGGLRATRNAAEERLAGANASWHDARVAVAAEVANQYYSLRSCEQLLAVARLDAASREDTARLTGLSADAGFQAPATAALARASAAEGKSRATLQRALCDIDIKTLVALTAIEEPELRARLLASTPVAPPAPAIAALPAQVLAQRPDVFTAEREVAAASFEVGSAQAQRYPRLALQGSIGRANLRSGGDNTQFDTWSIGPLALTLPIFDGGRRSANVDAARARYDAAVVSYRASARRAVSEVEQALVNLNSAAERGVDAQVSLDGYRAAFRAAEDRYKNGLGSLLELEDARRTRLAAENAVVTLQRERSAASVALYRAAGGGWTATPN